MRVRIGTLRDAQLAPGEWREPCASTRSASSMRQRRRAGTGSLTGRDRPSDSTDATRRANVTGLGLIGGSIGVALRERGWYVTGDDLDPVVADRALERGIVDAVGVDADAESRSWPRRCWPSPTRSSGRWPRPAGIVTDVGSVKGGIVGSIDDPRFVGGHPMAGSELEGLDGADAEMFVGAVWVLTPRRATADDDVRRRGRGRRRARRRRRRPAAPSATTRWSR